MKNLLDFRVNKIAYFENCFLLAVDRKPIDFIIDKVNTGSDYDSICHLYNIITNQIQNEYDCEIVPMTRYYEEAVQKI